MLAGVCVCACACMHVCVLKVKSRAHLFIEKKKKMVFSELSTRVLFLVTDIKPLAKISCRECVTFPSILSELYTIIWEKILCVCVCVCICMKHLRVDFVGRELNPSFSRYSCHLIQQERQKSHAKHSKCACVSLWS